MPAFQTIMLTGESRPAHGGADMAAYCAQAARTGITHMQINHLPDPYHPILHEEPDNYYAWFADYGPALDQFVASDLNRGLYPSSHLSRNLSYLLALTGAVSDHGLKPVLMLCEPRFVPDRFFVEHPELRGPRVDNPFFSEVPWYAMCTEHPVVRRHYRQMMMRLMEHVPDLAGISVFTHDSGAGFCHSRALYAGPNGCHCCRNTGAGERVAGFLGFLRRVAAEINPAFQVSLATGLEDDERGAFIAAAPEGVTGEVQGKWSWVGGLEDQWAWHQLGSSLEEIGHDAARQQREDEFAQRLRKVTTRDKPTIAICSMPTDGFYLPIRYVPHPFQNLQILDILRGMGIEHLDCKGALSPASLIRFEINRETFASYQADPNESAEQRVLGIATRWVGAELAESLVEAWREVDEAHRHRSMWNWSLPREISFMPGPLVPRPDELDPREFMFSDHVGFKCIDRMYGRHRLDVLRVDERERAWLLSNHLREVLPRIERAIVMLEAMLARCSEQDTRACLTEQLRHVRHFHLWQRANHNWCEAGCWLAPAAGSAKPAPLRTLPEIIDDEIAVTEALIDIYARDIDSLFATAPVDGLLYARGPGFVDHLRQRAAVMRKHRDDEPLPIQLPGVGSDERDTQSAPENLRESNLV